MAYSDFVRTFSQLEVIHLDGETSRDEPSLRHKTPWISRVYQGAWQRGVTAGGCRNNPGKIRFQWEDNLLSDVLRVLL